MISKNVISSLNTYNLIFKANKNVMGFIIIFVILALSSTKQKNVAWTEFERNDHACILPVMSLIC